MCLADEQTPLVHKGVATGHGTEARGGLSTLFAVLCVIDLFGVFPIVALPKPVIRCGWYGIPLVMGVFALQMYTAVLLGRCWTIARFLSPQILDKTRSPYSAIAELTFGPRMSRMVGILLNATVFCAGIPNLLVASENLQLLGNKMSDGSVDISYCVWLLVIGLLLCPVMWLGSPKDMKCIALTSALCVAVASACAWASVAGDTSAVYVPISVADPILPDLLAAYGIIAFQFDIHLTLLTIQVDMQNSSKIHIAILGGFLGTGVMFAITCTMAAMRYGSDVQANLLQGLPGGSALYTLAILVTLQLSLSSAVGHCALFQSLEDTLRVPAVFGLRRCLTRTAVLILGVILAEAVPRFDLTMALVGGTLTGPLMFVLPPLFYLKLTSMVKKKYSHCENIHKHGDSELSCECV